MFEKLTPQVVARFWSKVDVLDKDKCWNWKTGMSRPHFMHTSSSRVAWMIVHDEDPKDKMVLHTCDNARCVNTEHLYLGTSANNAQDRLTDGTQGKRKDITKETIRDIREDWEKDSGHGQITILAKKYNMSTTMLYNIVRRYSYKNVRQTRKVTA